MNISRQVVLILFHSINQINRLGTAIMQTFQGTDNMSPQDNITPKVTPVNLSQKELLLELKLARQNEPHRLTSLKEPQPENIARENVATVTPPLPSKGTPAKPEEVPLPATETPAIPPPTPPPEIPMDEDEPMPMEVDEPEDQEDQGEPMDTSPDLPDLIPDRYSIARIPHLLRVLNSPIAPPEADLDLIRQLNATLSPCPCTLRQSLAADQNGRQAVESSTPCPFTRAECQSPVSGPTESSEVQSEVQDDKENQDPATTEIEDSSATDSEDESGFVESTGFPSPPPSPRYGEERYPLQERSLNVVTNLPQIADGLALPYPTPQPDRPQTPFGNGIDQVGQDHNYSGLLIPQSANQTEDSNHQE